MKILILLPIAILYLNNVNLTLDFNSQFIDKDSTLSKKDYGQKVPGKTPILFSPEFIRTKHRIHSSPTFSPDMNEVYWSVFPHTSEFKNNKETVIFSKKVKNNWTSPKVASFSGEYTDGGPLFSSNGNKLYFYSRRPVNNNSKSETKGEIWFVEKQDEDWGEPKHLKIDFEGEKYFFSISKNNNLYFASGHGPGGAGRGLVDIYCTKFIDGTYTQPVRLPNEINSKEFVESDPLISPDEKHLIFFSFENPKNIGQYDLYISHHLENNQWSKPINLGAQINKGVSRFPRFSPDGKYIFFVRGVSGVYWMDSSFIFKNKN